MKRTHRFPQRLIRWTSLPLSLTLLLTTLITNNPQVVASRAPQQGQERRTTAPSPETGAPNAVLPNLDDTRRRRDRDPKIANHVESTMRSRRKPLESRRGLKVGERLP